MKKYIPALLVVILLAGFHNAALADDDVHEKSSWYIGFGIGSGNGAWNINNTEVTFDDYFEGADSTTPRVTINFGVGAILGQKFHLGFDGSAIREQGSLEVLGETLDVAVQINNYLGAVSYFPFTTGFFIKGGAGFSVMMIQAVYGSDTETESYSGTSVLAGAGYAIWIGKTFNLCLNAEYSYQSYSGDEAPDNSHFWNVYISFYWF